MSSRTDSICTTCPYCGVGCGVKARVANNEVIAVEGDTNHPANRGQLCIKGANLAATTAVTGRLKQPQIAGKPTDWDTALDLVAGRFNAVITEHGPEAVAFYLSGQLLTEDYYVANKLMKGFLGSANVDTNSRLCMASAVAAHKRAFGEDVVPCDYTDLEEADLVVLVGSNMAWAHPVVYQRLAVARELHGTRVVVVDPRVTPTCEIADLHLALNPGSDIDLFNALLTHLSDNSHIDHSFIDKHTEGWEETRDQADISITQTSAATGLTEHDLVNFLNWFAATDRVVTVFSQGVNQSSRGTDKANAIINCHLATGRIGRVGCGPFSITGQPNAMGGREVGGMASQLAAHMDFDADSIERIRRFWQAPNVASAPGLKAVDMFQALEEGKVKVIWIMGTNPAVSLPDSESVRRALAACPTVVVSDCTAATDTNVYADILLPAQGWGEKDGSVTNSERFVSRQRRLLPPSGDAMPDWWILCQVAARMGFAEAFNYANPAQIFAEHAQLSAFENNGERLFNLSHLAGQTEDEYDNMRPNRWPKARPFADARFSTPNRRARFIPIKNKPIKNESSGQNTGMLLLNTGRYRDQWHTMTRTGSVADLFQDSWLPALQIHPTDAAKRNIKNGDVVQVENHLGHVRLIADVTTDVKPGNLFAPIHWNDQFSGRANICQVIASVTDPISGQPDSKQARVNCRSIEAPLRIRLATTQGVSAETLDKAELQFWARIPGPGMTFLELAGTELSPILSLLDTCDMVTLEAVEHFRALGRIADQPAWLLFSTGAYCNLPSWRHLHALLTAETEDWRRLSSTPPGEVDTSRCVCTCFQVTERTIQQTIMAGVDSVAVLGETLSCGTNCGSCRHELQKLVNKHATKKLVAAV